MQTAEFRLFPPATLLFYLNKKMENRLIGQKQFEIVIWEIDQRYPILKMSKHDSNRQDDCIVTITRFAFRLMYTQSGVNSAGRRICIAVCFVGFLFSA